MAINNEHLDPEKVRNPHTRYERRTFNVMLVLMTMGGMLIGGILLHLTVAGLWKALDRWSSGHDYPTPEQAQARVYLDKTAPQLPPQPRLQGDPVSDLHRFRESEENVLTTYGWVDKNAGVVRIPVARALDLLAQRGLPNFPAAPGMAAGPAQGAAGTQVPAGKAKTGTAKQGTKQGK